VEGQVVEVELTWDTCLWLASELVNTIVVFGVVKRIGCHHVLDFDGDVLEVPSFNASSTQILDHAVNTGVDVVFVLSTGAHSTARAEHQDGEFWFLNTVNNTRELLGFVLTVELDGDIGKVKFFCNTSAGNNVHNS